MIVDYARARKAPTGPACLYSANINRQANDTYLVVDDCGQIRVQSLNIVMQGLFHIARCHKHSVHSVQVAKISEFETWVAIVAEQVGIVPMAAVSVANQRHPQL